MTALGLLNLNTARLSPQRRVDQRHRLLSLIFKNTLQNRSRKRRRSVFLNHTLISINHPVQMPAHKLRVQRPHLFRQRQIRTDRIEIFRINRRQIDTTLNGLTLQCIAHIHGNLPRHIFLRLKCRSPQMRRRNHLWPFNQRMINRRRLCAKHIQCSPCDLPRINRLLKCLLIHKLASGAVNNTHPIFAPGKRRLRNEMMGLIRKRCVQRNIIRPGKNLIVRRLLYMQLPRQIIRQKRIGTQQRHTKRMRASRHLLTNAPHANNTQRLAV